MRVQIDIACHPDEINAVFLARLEESATLILNDLRRERASRTVPASARIGSQPYRPQPGHGDENYGVIDVADQARFKRERDGKIK